MRSWVAVAAGDLELAVAASGEAADRFRALGPSVLRAASGWLAGEAPLEAGDPAACETLVLDAAGGVLAKRLPAADRCTAWYLLARAALDQRRPGQADEMLQRLDAAVPRLPGMSLPRSFAERARAYVLLYNGRPDAAVGAARAAAAAADEVGARVDSGRARVLAGQALVVAGDREGATAMLEAAHAELGASGAIRYCDVAARELRRLGRRAARTGVRRLDGDRMTSAAIAALSDREREIAGLVAAGSTNKEIGKALFLSTRTVERHLSNIYRKLGVASRAQLGALVTRAAD